MKIIIFGLGSIGQRHAQILLDSFDHELIAFRSNKNAKPNPLGIKEIFTWDEVEKAKPDVAFITNPTALHIDIALKCARQGMHLFIEKPLSATLDQIDELVKLCQKKKLTTYVAYCLRFHPVIKKIKELLADKEVTHVRVVCSSYLPHWRKGTDWKKCYSASKNLGGGVILDLSHEFDYIEYLFGEISEIIGKSGRATAVTVDAEDFADAVLVLPNKLCVNLHLNFMSLINERTLKIDFEGGYLIGDIMNSKVAYGIGEEVQTFDLKVERNAFTREQTAHFFDNLDNPRMMNNVSDAKRLLKKVIDFKNKSGA